MMKHPEAKAAIQQYMKAHNRPYSIQNVMDNMHGRVPRKICQDVLDELVAEKHLTEKEYGKAKIYLANQDNFPETKQEDLNELDVKVNEMKKLQDEKKDELKALKSKLASINSTMTNGRYIEEIAKLKESNAEAEKSLKAYTDGGIEQVTEEEVL